MIETFFRPGLKPKAVNITMAAYARSRELFAGTACTELFMEDIEEQASLLDPSDPTQPHVLHLDFQGIRTLNHQNAVVALEPVINDLRGAASPVYSIFDNLAPEVTLQLREILSWFEHTKPVVVARKATQPNFELLGDATKIGWYDKSWRWIAGRQHWIPRSSMRRALGLNRQKAGSIFPRMAKEGLILQAVQGVSENPRVFYRSLL